MEKKKLNGQLTQLDRSNLFNIIHIELDIILIYFVNTMTERFN